MHCIGPWWEADSTLIGAHLIIFPRIGSILMSGPPLSLSMSSNVGSSCTSKMSQNCDRRVNSGEEHFKLERAESVQRQRGEALTGIIACMTSAMLPSSAEWLCWLLCKSRTEGPLASGLLENSWELPAEPSGEGAKGPCMLPHPLCMSLCTRGPFVCFWSAPPCCCFDWLGNMLPN